ncbi:MAG: hypothetical protein ABFD92_02010 [Planctomycetaceae bacterium]|nr:hypothetical protein [Planctomycetaceae bacterium]
MNEWQPIDTAPKDGTPVLACTMPMVEKDGRLCPWNFPSTYMWDYYHPNAKGKSCWRDSFGRKNLSLTHWMPVPGYKPGKKRKAKRNSE